MSGDGDLSRRFIEFSAEVTAFSAFDLHGTGHAEIYRSVVTRVVGEEVLTDLLDAYDRAVADSADADAQAKARALAAEVFSDDKLGAIARNIIKLWYAANLVPAAGRLDRHLRRAGQRRYVHRLAAGVPRGAALAGRRLQSPGSEGARLRLVGVRAGLPAHPRRGDGTRGDAGGPRRAAPRCGAVAAGTGGAATRHG